MTTSVARHPRAPMAGDGYGNPRAEWLDVDWRKHLRTVDAEGVPVNLVDMGSGSPIVFLHGLGGSWQNWLENLPYFARSYRVIAPDLPGFGHTPMPDWELTIPNYGRHVEALFGALDLEPAALVGNSMGGFIAAEAAIAYPRRIDRLVMISPAGLAHHGPRPEPARLGARAADLLAGPLLWLSTAEFRRPRWRWGSFRHIVHRPLGLRPELLCELMVNGMDRPGLVGAMDGILAYDFRDRLERINAPTLIIWGRNDHIVPIGSAGEYHRLIPQADLEVYEETGHLAMAERPGRFNADLESFLESRQEHREDVEA